MKTLEEFYKKGNKYRWKGVKKEDRVAHAKMMVAARESKKLKTKTLTPNDTIIKINK